MANKQHLEILKQGVEAWNQWRIEHPRRPNLTGAQFVGASFRGANLGRVDLRNANLTKADLRGANLIEADLTDAFLGEANCSGANLTDARLDFAHFILTNLSETNLDRAILVGTHLRDADLTNATLIRAVLTGAIFKGTVLNGANLDEAFVVDTAFANCDLTKAKGLDSVLHLGPSTIGIDTIYKSRGKIPEKFLRGCGVPEGLITEMHSLIGAVEGIQFYSCFISYSGKDEDFARRLHSRMREAGLRVWFAPEDIQGGKKLHEQIESAIRIYDKLLIVLSEASLQSEWVMDELRKGFKSRARERKA